MITRRQQWLLIAGLSFAILANITTIALQIQAGQPLTIVGNVVAAVICAGAIWLVRARMKGRL